MPKDNNPVVHRGEVYWADLGEEIKGNHVQKGKRLVVVVSNRIGNRFSPVILVVPCTTKNKKEIVEAKLPTQVELDLVEPSVAMCEQIISIDKSQLLGKYGKITENQMELLNHALLISLELMDF
jgi:mRNA interferase MazF